MTQQYLDHALIGKTIKAAENKEGEIPTIYFTDGSYLEIFIDDNDDLIIQLVGKEIEYERPTN